MPAPGMTNLFVIRDSPFFVIPVPYNYYTIEQGAKAPSGNDRLTYAVVDAIPHRRWGPRGGSVQIENGVARGRGVARGGQH